MLLKGLKRFLSGEASAEKYLNKMAKQKILQQEGKWVPKFIAESRKQAIRDARSMRSAASKAELAWMQANPDKATKVYKSGTREFGGNENKLALLKVRQDAIKPFIEDRARRIRRNRAIGTGIGIGVGLPIGYMATSEPVQQYVGDLYQNNVARPLLGQQRRTLTNEDYQDGYLDDHNRLAQIAYRQYVRQHGYPKPGETINLPINPSVYKEINKDGKYAKFSLKNLIRAAARRDNQFEFTDGGMSGTARINPKTGELEVTNNDVIAWESDSDEQRQKWKHGNLGQRIRYFMDQHGSNSDNGDRIVLTTTIPADTISGNFRGRLRDIPVYKKK